MKLTLLLSVLATVVSVQASAQVYKCVKADGSIEFSAVACSADVGAASDTGIMTGQKSQAEIQSIHEESQRAASLRQSTSPAPESALNSPNKPRVTIVRDSSKGLTLDEIVRARMENQRIRAENGIPEPKRKRVNYNCIDSGKITNCYGSDGSNSTTVRSGNSSNTTLRQ